MRRNLRGEILIAVTATFMLGFALIFAVILASNAGDNLAADDNSTIITQSTQAPIQTLTTDLATQVVLRITATRAAEAEPILMAADGNEITSIAAQVTRVRATSTPRRSATPQPSMTATATPTATATATSTATSSPTNTVIPSATTTPTMTDVPTETTTPTATITPSSTATYTPTPSPTPTLTATPSPTPTENATLMAIFAAEQINAAVEATLTAIQVGIEQTQTAEPTHTYTPTATYTASFTPTPTSTITPSPSSTPSYTPTATASYTATATATITASFTPTLTPSATPTATPTATNTPTATTTSTPTIVPTATSGILAALPDLTASETEGIYRYCVIPADWPVYTLQEGDTLYAIASASGIDLADLRDVNCISFADEVVAGAEVFVPELPNQELLQMPAPPLEIGLNLVAEGCSSIAAFISSPVALQRINGITTIFGNAGIQNFEAYTIEIRADNQPSYSRYSRSLESIQSGVLGTIDTSFFAPGLYWLQLRVSAISTNEQTDAICSIPVFIEAA